jgi:tetratricopeptide (TPR) repeat protein
MFRLERQNVMYTSRHGGKHYIEDIKKYLSRLPESSQVDVMKRFLSISYSYRRKEDPQASQPRRERFQRRFNTLVRDYHELAQRQQRENGNTTYNDLFASVRLLASVGPEGRRLAEELQRLAPTNPRIHADLAQDYLDAGDVEKAVKTAERSIRLDPLAPEPHRTLAQARYQNEDYAGAYDAAKTAIGLNPKDAVSFSIMKLSQSRVPALEEAPAEVEEIPDVASSMGLAGLDHLARGPAANAGSASLVDAAADPAIGANAAMRAQFLASRRLVSQSKLEIQKGDMGAAVALATRALQKYRRNWEALFRRAQAELRRGNLDDALADTTRAIELAGEEAGPVLFTLHARVLNRLGRHAEALDAASAALERGTTDPKARARTLFQHAWALAGIGKAKDALTSLDRAAKLDHRFVAFYQELLELPDESDMAVMFAAQDNFAGRSPNLAERAPKQKNPKQRTIRILMFSLAGGILVALGLLHVLSGTRRSTTGGAASLASDDLEDGLIAGTYRVKRKIAAGGMGIVFEADDVHLERRVAIKKMREEISFDRRERERFLREARTVARLKHPNIVEIHSVVGDGDDIYLVFEYVDGHTVSDYISGYKKIPFDQAVRIVQGAAAALYYAHKKGVIHRDLKPSNIMISSEGMVKVMDFGVARQAKESMSSVVSQTISGTPQYMPPEQEQGRVEQASDVYSLAVCFYEMVTGEMPFAGTAGGMSLNKLRRRYVRVTERNHSLPTGLDQIMDWALEPDPDKRCHSPMKFSAALESLLQPKVGPFDAVS